VQYEGFLSHIIFETLPYITQIAFQVPLKFIPDGKIKSVSLNVVQSLQAIANSGC
jgi:hypothetical protein